MGRLKAIFHNVTGASSRHNRALRELCEWVDSVQQFLIGYQLYSTPDAGYILEKNGDAKFDLTSIAYKARSMPATVKNIRDEQIMALFTGLAGAIEETRRTLMNPTLKNVKIQEVAGELRLAFEKLRNRLDSIENM